MSALRLSQQFSCFMACNWNYVKLIAILCRKIVTFALKIIQNTSLLQNTFIMCTCCAHNETCFDVWYLGRQVTLIKYIKEFLKYIKELLCVLFCASWQVSSCLYLGFIFDYVRQRNQKLNMTSGTRLSRAKLQEMFVTAYTICLKAGDQQVDMLTFVILSSLMVDACH